MNAWDFDAIHWAFQLNCLYDLKRSRLYSTAGLCSTQNTPARIPSHFYAAQLLGPSQERITSVLVEYCGSQKWMLSLLDAQNTAGGSIRRNLRFLDSELGVVFRPIVKHYITDAFSRQSTTYVSTTRLHDETPPFAISAVHRLSNTHICIFEPDTDYTI